MRNFALPLFTVLFFTTSFYKPINYPEKLEMIKPENGKSGISSSNNVKINFSGAEIYSTLLFENMNVLNQEVFEKAYLGFLNLKKEGKLQPESHLLTICDFSLSSTKKRLWVVDLNERKVIFNSLVAHGKNTGEEFAQKFSNIESSYQTSLGFYLTESTYTGANGYSLKLLGMDEGYNDAALQRAIVMHGADYVSESFIKNQKRIGRSWGCPAVPRDLAAPLINTIKGQNVLFIYYPDTDYLSNSKWLKAEEIL